MVGDNPTCGLIMAKRTARWNLTERWRLKTALDIPALLFTLLTLLSWWIISLKMTLGSFSHLTVSLLSHQEAASSSPKILGSVKSKSIFFPCCSLVTIRERLSPSPLAWGERCETTDLNFRHSFTPPEMHFSFCHGTQLCSWPAGPTSPASLAATTAPLTPAPKRRQVAAAVLHLNILFWSIDWSTYNVQTYVWDIKIFVYQQCSLMTWLPRDCCNTTTQLDFYLLFETGLCPLALWSPESQLILYYTHHTYYTICKHPGNTFKVVLSKYQRL